VPDRRARLSVIQARHVPGRALVTVTGPDGITTRYAVYFARPAVGDDFNGAGVGRRWAWIRRDPSAEHVTGGALIVTPEPGDLAGRTNTARNLLVQPALGDWSIQSRLTFGAAPAEPGPQAGIIAYESDDNYLKLDWEYSGGAASLTETSENGLSGAPVTQVLTRVPTAGTIAATVWLRMTKRGSQYTTSWSANGVNWVQMYSVGASLTDVEVGLFAYTGSVPASPFNVAFDYLHVVGSGTTLGAGALKKPR
jgi:regulation of enolase protein 1 (concanavalin A-like superfamily)